MKCSMTGQDTGDLLIQVKVYYRGESDDLLGRFVKNYLKY
jgi:hypothetical protein